MSIKEDNSQFDNADKKRTAVMLTTPRSRHNFQFLFSFNLLHWNQSQRKIKIKFLKNNNMLVFFSSCYLIAHDTHTVK